MDAWSSKVPLSRATLLASSCGEAKAVFAGVRCTLDLQGGAVEVHIKRLGSVKPRTR